MDEATHECPDCGEEWYADGEEGQEVCPNCGKSAVEFHETM
jgi:rubrerythrin